MFNRMLPIFLSLVFCLSGANCRSTVRETDENESGANYEDTRDTPGAGHGQPVNGVSFVIATAERGIIRGEPIEIVNAAASFFSAGEMATENTYVDRTIVGPCVLMTGLPQGTPEPSMFEPLDAGPSATLNNGATRVEFVAEAVGFYAPPRDVLRSEGFAPGQSWIFSFPGGNDIRAFMLSIDLPEYLTLTAPDLDEPDFAIDTNAPLTFAWTATDRAGVR